MLDIVLSSSCPTVRSRFSAACVLMQANLHVVDYSRIEEMKPIKNAWFLLDVDLSELSQVIPVLVAKGVNTERRLIRIVQDVWQSHCYHDVPIFASLVKPADPLAASDVLKRLMDAKPFTITDRTQPSNDDPFAAGLIKSKAMQVLVAQLNSLAGLPVDTVLLGPTGAGKDTAAHWLHTHSGVSGRFVHLNCAALPEQLFEAELFGVKAGAFTGATESRPGLMLLADQGTLYLDEIDSLPLSCQAKLLTALQYRGATPLGGTEPFTSSFRLIVSTKTDFKALVQKGAFREDLYYRLNLSQVSIPSLQERIEDILPLYEHFLAEAALNLKRPLPELSLTEEAFLLSAAWPGNVRELRAHAFRRVIGLASDLQETNDQASIDLKQLVNEYERVILRRCIQKNSGNVKESARQLNLQPQ
ncbi:MAG: sigma 54-interacting transcriptional regulator, partial [Limnobacter sp.]|nr:sigma 54-interacting transcriptional regulator [Limnobacter sp.]